MQSFYFLPVLVILLQGAMTAEMISEHDTFVKLCFLPKDGPINFHLNSLFVDKKPLDRYYGIIGNEIMRQRMYQFFTDKKERGSTAELDKMCLIAFLDNVNEKGESVGSLHGFNNLTVNYTCQNLQDFPGIYRCNFESASRKFDEEALVYWTIVDDNAFFEIDCFKSGQVGWVLYSTIPQLSEEDIKYYYAHAATLGFPTDTNTVIHGDSCAL